MPASSNNGVHELAIAFEAVLSGAVERAVEKSVGPVVEKSIRPFAKRFDGFEKTIIDLLDEREKKLEARMITLEKNVQSQISVQHENTISRVEGMVSILDKQK